MRLGLISDTHGLLRPEALAFLQGCARIIHGGDIGGPEILERLAQIAPVDAVRGNNDRGAWARELPETRLLRFGTVQVYVIHDLAQMGAGPQPILAAAVVSGHSHKPSLQERTGVLYVNPGSAGPRRFKLPIAAAELNIVSGVITARIVDLVT